MAGASDPKSGRTFSEDELAWLDAHAGDLRHGVADRRFRSLTLWTGLAVGLIVHVVGFLFKASVTGEPVAVLADLLYALGWALWTGVIVVAIVEIIPEVKERQIGRYLDAYERALRTRTHAKGSAPPS